MAHVLGTLPLNCHTAPTSSVYHCPPPLKAPHSKPAKLILLTKFREDYFIIPELHRHILGLPRWLRPEKAMAPHSSTLAWKIPWTEEPGGLQSMGSLRVRHN